MARSSYAQSPQLTEEESKLLQAQTGLTSAQIDALIQKTQLDKAQLLQEGELGQAKIGLGEKEITSKEKQSQLAAALEALGHGSRENIAAQGERGAIASDLAKRPDIDLKVLGSTLAESGQPGLYNALARSNVDKREQLINATIPSLQSARSDAEREKKLKPALEAAYPGAYNEALARAFPKAGQEAAGAAPMPALWSGSAPGAGTGWVELANTLLRNSGNVPTVGGAVAPTGVVPSNRTIPGVNAPVNALADPSVGALVGSRTETLPSGLTRVSLPSGGTATVKSRQGEGGIADYISKSTEKYPPAAPEPVTPTVAGGPIIPSGLVQGETAPVTIPTEATNLPNVSGLKEFSGDPAVQAMLASAITGQQERGVNLAQNAAIDVARGTQQRRQDVLSQLSGLANQTPAPINWERLLQRKEPF